MKKPNGYDEVQVENTGFERLILGGHKIVIKKIEECTSANGKEYLKVWFDTDSTDVQPSFFMKQYEADTRENKRYAGMTVLFVEDFDGNCSRQLKALVTSAERSNAGFTVQWGEDFCKCFVGKKIGGVFGEEEYISGDDVKKSTKLRWFTSVDKVVDAEVPKLKEIPAEKRPQAQQATNDGFMTIPDGIDEELPFN